VTDRPCILALDIGSSSVRARLYGRSLSALDPEASAMRRYLWHVEAGAMTTAANPLLELTAEVIDEIVSLAESRGARIEGVGVATFWHSLLGLNASGEPITPVHAWGDSRSRGAAAELRKALGEAEYHARTGCFLSPVYPAMKIAWLRQAEPPTFGAVATWASFGDLLAERLFGSFRTSLSIASGTGLLDLKKLEWDEEVLNAVGLRRRQMPEVADLEPFRGLRSEWAERWPTLEDVPWLPAVGDGACANLGSGAVGASKPGLTVGTSAAVRVLRGGPEPHAPPPDLWQYLLDRHHTVTGGALSNGGNGLAFLRQTFPTLTLERIEDALAAGPGSRGLAVVPSLADERVLGEAPGPGALLMGLRLSTMPVDIAAAWLEAIARRVAQPFRALESEYGPAREVRASGGAFNALPAWLQTFADVLGRPVALVADPEATSRGAAILAARELGWIDSLDAAPEIATHAFEPDSERHEFHLRAADRENAAERALRSGL
jgi:gluconokinase